MIALERRECEWIHTAGRMTAGGERAETSTAEMIQQASAMMLRAELPVQRKSSLSSVWLLIQC